MLRLPEVRFPTFGPTHMLLVVAALLLALFAYSALQTAAHTYGLRELERSLQADVLELREQRAELEGLSEYLRSDEYIEGVARTQFGLVRPGETAVSVDGPPSPQTPVQPGERWWQTLFER